MFVRVVCLSLFLFLTLDLSLSPDTCGSSSFRFFKSSFYYCGHYFLLSLAALYAPVFALRQHIFSFFFIYYICAREGALITHRTARRQSQSQWSRGTTGPMFTFLCFYVSHFPVVRFLSSSVSLLACSGW